MPCADGANTHLEISSVFVFLVLKSTPIAPFLVAFDRHCVVLSPCSRPVFFHLFVVSQLVLESQVDKMKMSISLFVKWHEWNSSILEGSVRLIALESCCKRGACTLFLRELAIFVFRMGCSVILCVFIDGAFCGVSRACVQVW